MKNNYRSKNDVFKGREAERRRREGEYKGEWVLLMGSIIDGKGVKYLWSLKFYVTACLIWHLLFRELTMWWNRPPTLNNRWGIRGGRRLRCMWDIKPKKGLKPRREARVFENVIFMKIMISVNSRFSQHSYFPSLFLVLCLAHPRISPFVKISPRLCLWHSYGSDFPSFSATCVGVLDIHQKKLNTKKISKKQEKLYN